MLSLIGFSDTEMASFDTLSTSDIQKVLSGSNFGGNAVGGIVGKVYMYGMVNRLTADGNKSDSTVNAVVFGQDFVGGALGNIVSVSSYINCFNLYSGGKVSGDSPCKADPVVSSSSAPDLVKYYE